MMDKLNLKYINTESNSKYTIVFLHEGLGCIQTWQNYPQYLCKAIDVKGLVYDRSGYGESPGNLSNRKNDYLIKAAEDLNELILKLNLNNIILYGHSDGASIALAYASLYQKRIKAVISEAPHVIVEKITIDGIKKAIIAFQKGKLKGLSKWHGANYESVFNSWANTWLNPNFDLKELRLLLPQINSPLLVIQGNKDQYGSLLQIDTIRNEVPKNMTTYIANCGHSPYLEQESEILNFVSTYLKKIVYE